MNGIIQQLQNHKSIRKYKTQPIEQSIIDAIIQATQQAPSWINGQQMSIIRVTDAQKREKLQQLAGNQAYVGAAPEFWVFCLDFFRASKACAIEGKPFSIADNVDALLVGATDVGIALGTAIAAAESYGIGTVPIGGVRKDPQAVIELLELPYYVYPVSGLCLGYADDEPALKPRLPKQTVVFENAYNTDIDEALQLYNKQFVSYMIERSNGTSNANWSSGIAAFYSDPFYRDNSYADPMPALQKQGFLKNN